jgi:type I restriction enzyme M protein
VTDPPYGLVEYTPRELTGEAEDIENAVYDLKAVNPHAKNEEDTRTPEELLDLIEAKGREIAQALAVLRRGTKGGK